MFFKDFPEMSQSGYDVKTTSRVMNSGLADESTEDGFPRADNCLHTVTMANGCRKPSQGSQRPMWGLAPHTQPHRLAAEMTSIHPTPQAARLPSVPVGHAPSGRGSPPFRGGKAQGHTLHHCTPARGPTPSGDSASQSLDLCPHLSNGTRSPPGADSQERDESRVRLRTARTCGTTHRHWLSPASFLKGEGIQDRHSWQPQAPARPLTSPTLQGPRMLAFQKDWRPQWDSLSELSPSGSNSLLP